MDIRFKIVGIVSLALFAGAFALIAFAMDAQHNPAKMNLAVLEKSVDARPAGGTGHPATTVYYVNGILNGANASGIQIENRTAWDSLDAGGNYTLDCFEIFGHWHCS